MTRPRPRFRNQVVHATRRTLLRQCRLRPIKAIRDLIGYVVALFVEKHELRYHAGMAMPNHKHESFTDPLGQRSEYYRDVHSTIAKALNCLQERVQVPLWDNQVVGDTEALDPEAVWDDILYIVLNPVRAGLVRTPNEWAGFWIGPKHWGKEITFERPEFYFTEKWPDTATLRPVAPDLGDGRTPEQLRAAALRDQRDAIRAERKRRTAAGRGFRGMKNVQQTPLDWAPSTDPGAFQLKPRYKARGQHAADARLLAIQRDRWWLYAYRLAMKHRRVARFPEGTEKLLRLDLVWVDARRDYGMYPLARAAPRI